MTSQTGPLARRQQQRAAQVRGVEVVLPCPQYRLRGQDVTTDEALRATPISLALWRPIRIHWASSKRIAPWPCVTVAVAVGLDASARREPRGGPCCFRLQATLEHSPIWRYSTNHAIGWSR